MSGLFNSTKLKNCSFFSLRDWKFIWNTFKAGGGDASGTCTAFEFAMNSLEIWNVMIIFCIKTRGGVL